MIVISVYSGKCDLYDHLGSYDIEEIINKYKIYYCDQILPLEVKKKKDLIPYYPFLVHEMASTKENGGAIRISSESFVDREEREQLQWILDAVLKYWRKCKRNHVEFNKEEALEIISWLGISFDYEKEIINRVAEYGKDATIDGIHKPLHDNYRQRLYEEMVYNGWENDKAYRWCYGYDRWIEWIKEKKKNDVASLGD